MSVGKINRPLLFYSIVESSLGEDERSVVDLVAQHCR